MQEFTFSNKKNPHSNQKSQQLSQSPHNFTNEDESAQKRAPHAQTEYSPNIHPLFTNPHQQQSSSGERRRLSSKHNSHSNSRTETNNRSGPNADQLSSPFQMIFRPDEGNSAPKMSGDAVHA